MSVKLKKKKNNKKNKKQNAGCNSFNRQYLISMGSHFNLNVDPIQIQKVNLYNYVLIPACSFFSTKKNNQKQNKNILESLVLTAK